jgi:hypothetical protein
MRGWRSVWLLVIGFGFAFAQKGDLALGDATLASGEFVDVFAVTADAAGPLTVALSSEEFDVYLIVLDAVGRVLLEVDDGEGAGTDVRASVNVAAGTYRIVVTSAFPGETGRYLLQVGVNGAPRKALPASLSASPPASSPAAPPASPPAAVPLPVSPPTPLPGHAFGRVTHPDGRPIAVPGAVVTVAISGVAFTGTQVNLTVQPDAEGRYAQRLPDGSYQLRGSIELPFDGGRYRFDLDPLGAATANRDSAPGIAQDFVWRTSGLRPGAPEGSTDRFDYFGASIILTFMTYRQDVGRAVPPAPADARLLFTLTPVGASIDGGAVGERTFERRPDPRLGGVTPEPLLDVPIGVYTLSGVQIDALGAVTPLLMQRSFAEYGPDVVVRFTPTFSGATPPIVGFTLP